MEHLDIHVALEACDIVTESATIVTILDLKTKSSAAPGSGRKTNELPGTSMSPGSTFCSR
jgi:hypothetical protein